MTRGQAMAGLALVLLAIIFARLVSNYAELEHLRPLAAYYVQQAPADLGAANVVTAILITYRGFDTLGEVAVLFMVAASVGVVLERRSPNRPKAIGSRRRARSSLPAPASWCRSSSCSAPM